MVPSEKGAGVSAEDSDDGFTAMQSGTIMLSHGWATRGLHLEYEDDYVRKVRVDKDSELYAAMLVSGFEPDAEDDACFTFRGR